MLSLRSADSLLEDEKLLLPLTVYGFVLRTRSWGSDVTFHRENCG